MFSKLSNSHKPKNNLRKASIFQFRKKVPFPYEQQPELLESVLFHTAATEKKNKNKYEKKNIIC